MLTFLRRKTELNLLIFCGKNKYILYLLDYTTFKTFIISRIIISLMSISGLNFIVIVNCPIIIVTYVNAAKFENELI